MKPQEIKDQAVPLLDGSTTQITGANTNPVVEDTPVPTTQVDQVFPPVIIAQETIAQSFNTETKAIKGEFTFESLGAIRIGEFSQGVSGEVDISPNGILAKNVNGDTTFALDGTTGDATFLGTVEASGFIIADETGLHSLNNFNTAFETSGTVTIPFTRTVYADLGTQKGITLTRATKAIILLSVVGSSEQINPTLDCSGRTYYQIYSDTSGELCEFFYDSFIIVAPRSQENIISKTYSSSNVFTLAAGHHNISIQSKLDLATNFRSIADQWNWTVLLLGS